MKTAPLLIAVVLVSACDDGATDTGETTTETATETGTETESQTGGAPCDACGDAPCRPPAEAADEADCLGPDPLCVPAAETSCTTCMEQACGEWVGAQCSGFDCIDYAVVIGGCGDATPYAEAYECMAQNCDAECNPGDGFSGCECV